MYRQANIPNEIVGIIFGSVLVCKCSDRNLLLSFYVSRVKNRFSAGNDLKTVLLHNSVSLCVTRFCCFPPFLFSEYADSHQMFGFRCTKSNLLWTFAVQRNFHGCHYVIQRQFSVLCVYSEEFRNFVQC